MTASLTPWKTASAVVSLGGETPGWNLADCPEDNPEAPRTFSIHIEFAERFQWPPVVQAGLAGFDLDQRDSARLSVAVTKVNATGFDLSITTWMTTRVYSVEVSWLALGS
jgi:hypothetical protein